MNKEILRLAIPNILSNLSVPLLSSVDTALMGQLSPLHIGAVGIGSMIFNVLYWNFVFLRMGTTGMTAQAFGRRAGAEIIHTLARSFLLVLIVATLALALQRPLGRAAFWALSISADHYELVATYFYIRIWALPATLGMYTFLGWYFGLQNALIPLLLTIIINVVNIGCNFLFVYHYGMDVDGVAWGTLIAQYTGLLLALGLAVWKYKRYFKMFSLEAMGALHAFRRFLAINKDIFLRTLCLTFSYGFFYHWSSRGGETVLAVNVILLQFLTWMSFGIDGFAFAAESLVGKYFGAGDHKRLRRSIRLSFLWGFGLALIISATYGFFGRSIVSIFTADPPIVAASQPFLIWVLLFPIVSVASFMWDGVYVGLTASRAMRNSMAGALVFFLLTFYIVHPILGNHGLWLAFSIFMFTRGGIQTWLFRIQGVRLR